ncbi:hypothetical protein HZS61_008916 [Fusarium oxysporum f. sp. conglutinans]|uniref:Uncharacterized protein n=1 Tax=Fusarium oxysporum f. sp. conglutinans TaxID=100902 RepID=A0A8H6H1I9_FUSOX|nr:hypothetical protein HZS61_008916 [Fusarium oxysporum f. sp. conglutinans]
MATISSYFGPGSCRRPGPERVILDPTYLNPRPNDHDGILIEPGEFERNGKQYVRYQPIKVRWLDTPEISGRSLVKRSALSQSVCTHAGTATGADLHWLNGICTGKSTYTVNCAPADNKNAGSSHPGTCPPDEDCFQLERVGNFWGDLEPDVTCAKSGTVFDAADVKTATHVNGKVVTRAGKPKVQARLIRLKAQVYRRDGHYGQTSRMGFFRNGKEQYHIDNVASMGPTWNFDPSTDQSFSFFFTPGPDAFRVQGTINLA